MSNVSDYHNTWMEYRNIVSNARKAYLEEVDRLSVYLPSEQAQRQIDDAKENYDAALESARIKAKPKFAHAIRGMRNNIHDIDMSAPTAEQLSILQMLDMRDHVSAQEVEHAAKAMGNNDAALSTLRDILMRKGKTLPLSAKTFEARLLGTVDQLERSADHLMAWNGRSGREVFADFTKARNAHVWGNGPRVSETALISRGVADIEAGVDSYETIHKIVGDAADHQIVNALG